jgi:hypothetical protein
MVEIKKLFMKHVWRIQQVGALGSLVMLAMTIALILYPMVDWRFFQFGLTQEHDWLIVIILWLLVIGVVLVGGFTYDVLLRMWVPQQRVAVERNPFAKNLMNPKECINWQYCWVPMLKKLGCDKEAEFMQKWNEHMMNEDPVFRNEVYKVIKWINSYELPPPKKRYLTDDLLVTDFNEKSIQQIARKYIIDNKITSRKLEIK